MSKRQSLNSNANADAETNADADAEIPMPKFSNGPLIVSKFNDACTNQI